MGEEGEMKTHNYDIFSKHNKKLSDNPDIVNQKHKSVIFIDSEFWYGYIIGLKRKQKLRPIENFGYQ